ncbi:polyprenol monophosphomannose synthase [Candidatus Sumerlaeota bacterium]|nr:polyprenol monophosphomannose synthase [Candidatus Sumerlaeota bacterium]
MIPTYNEAENIIPLIGDILALGPEFEALVVDDNSPDGTWKLVKEMADKNSRVHLLHRVHNKGRGLAGIAGFREAVRLGADWVIEMDADFSHHPRFIPDLAAASKDADLVIGSRLVPGGGEQGRSPARKYITAFASFFIRTVLGLPVRDPTSGFRLFSRRLLESLPWDAMRARGPEVVQEVLVAAHARGFKMVEVPILFEERRAGESTFNLTIMIRSFFAVLRLRLFPGELVPRRK